MKILMLNSYFGNKLSIYINLILIHDDIPQQEIQSEKNVNLAHELQL